MPERFEIYIVYKRRYINTLPFLFLQCTVMAWRSGSVVSTGMGDRVRVRLQQAALFRYVTNHPGRLSLLPSVGR